MWLISICLQGFFREIHKSEFYSGSPCQTYLLCPIDCLFSLIICAQNMVTFLSSAPSQNTFLDNNKFPWALVSAMARSLKMLTYNTVLRMPSPNTLISELCVCDSVLFIWIFEEWPQDLYMYITNLVPIIISWLVHVIMCSICSAIKLNGSMLYVQICMYCLCL